MHPPRPANATRIASPHSARDADDAVTLAETPVAMAMSFTRRHRNAGEALNAEWTLPLRVIAPLLWTTIRALPDYNVAP